MAEADAGAATPGKNTQAAEIAKGSIAARIDRLPLTRTQYLLAGITQLYWGLLIDTDALVARLYPFVWEPRGITTFQFSLLLAANIGFGILTGQYAGGYLSDRFGRKRVLVASALVDAAFLWPIALTYNFWWLLLWNFLYGIGLGLMLSANNVYLHEIAPPNMRQKLAMRTQLITGVAAFIPGILGILFVPHNWQWFIYVLVLLQLALTPIGMFLLPESPRWLEGKGRTEEADRIVAGWERKIEARTGPLPEPVDDRNLVRRAEKVPVGELFGGEYGRRTILIVVVWCLVYSGMIYGTTTYLPTYLVDNDWSADEVFFWISIVAAAMRVGAFFVASYTGERIERKNLLLTLGLVWAVLMMGLLVFDVKIAQIIVVLLAYPLGTLWLFNMYNYTSAAYPTRFRSAGYSWTNGLGHTAAVWAPIIIGPIFAATASQRHYGWILWVAVAGAVVPSLLIGKWGVKQKGRTLEEVSR